MTKSFYYFRQVAFSLFCLFSFGKIDAQSLPPQMTYTPDEHRLTTGGVELSGFYDEANINTIELFFDQNNFWQLMESNYNSGTDLGAQAIINGDTLEHEVGVRFKGTTSYFLTFGEDKKSFNITLDFADDDQDYEGYETLNLNNCFDDPTFMKEVLFYHFSRRHIPIANANFTRLFINGEDWGIYPNVQQLNGEFFDEWFLSNDGTSWRALDPDFGFGPGGGGGGGGGGNPFGTGFSSLNWLGNDVSEYEDWYTLKRTSKDEPWEDLVHVCDVLNNTPLADLEVAANEVMDIDRTLWFLAHETVFSDDDGYIYKGGMDYYLYWEPETGRMVPQEYDANSVMFNDHADWSPFYHENDSDYVLMNRLYAVPELRQRYLAHMRTIIAESLDQATFDAQVDIYTDLIEELVEDDPKKLYSYTQFLNGVEALKSFVEDRREFLLAYPEVEADGLEISDVSFSADGSPFTYPDAGQTVNVTARIDGAMGVLAVQLYHGTGFVGKFEKQEMFDDGAHGDGAAGDGIFGAELPAYGNGIYVRFYIEAVADDAAKTVTYDPIGAEHDVYMYRVNVSSFIDSDVVINEFMAKNDNAQADQDGEFDDWIELYNTTTSPVDLSGWYLSDNPAILDKWTFPAGSIVNGESYLIVWADEDGSQAGLHANFKLSGDGEILYLVDPNLEVAQEIEFGEQEDDMGYARVPNGTGDFTIQFPTFGYNNDLASSTDEVEDNFGFSIYPNPARQTFSVSTEMERLVEVGVFNALGQQIFFAEFFKTQIIDASDWQAGMYHIKVGDQVQKLVVE